MKNFVKDKKALSESVLAFMDAPEYWRDAIGSNPKYFVHLKRKGKHLFGLSKFCAFENALLEDYVIKLRHTTDGGTTQKHIKKIVGKEWVSFKSTSKEVQKEFRAWLDSITDGRIGYDHIYILNIKESSRGSMKAGVNSLNKKGKVISPGQLLNRLAEQNKVGSVGEEIALNFEVERLEKLGAKKSDVSIEHTSKKNVAAGFDLRSQYKKQIRHIEVKSSKSRNGDIYISPNELSTLKKLGDSAYLYFVHVTDVRKKKGEVLLELKNPFPSGSDTKWLSPCLFTGKPPLGVK